MGIMESTEIYAFFFLVFSNIIPQQTTWQAKLEFALLKQKWKWIMVRLHTVVSLSFLHFHAASVGPNVTSSSDTYAHLLLSDFVHPLSPSSLPISSPLQGFFLAEYFNLVMHNFIYYLEGVIWGEDGPPPPLEDLGIRLFAGVFPPSAEWIVDLFLYILIGTALILCLARFLLNNVPWGGPQMLLIKKRGDGSDVATCSIPVPSVNIIKRICKILSIAIVCRVLSYTLTLEPNPAAYCHPPFWNPPSTVGEIMSKVAVRGSCGDLLFSSHTFHGMVMMLTILRHAPGMYVICGMAVCSMVMVVITLLSYKSHYSHDIVQGKPMPSLLLFVRLKGTRFMSIFNDTLQPYS